MWPSANVPVAVSFCIADAMVDERMMSTLVDAGATEMLVTPGGHVEGTPASSPPLPLLPLPAVPPLHAAPGGQESPVDAQPATVAAPTTAEPSTRERARRNQRED